MIKIRISKNGYLERLRGRYIKTLNCPLDHNVDEYCGDWCAQFDGPYEIGKKKKDEIICLDICGTEITCLPDEFEDLRE